MGNPLEERLRTVERDWDELHRQNNQLIELHNALERERNEARAERDRLREALDRLQEAHRKCRWNIREDHGDLYVCRGEHDKALGCEEQRFILAPDVAKEGMSPSRCDFVQMTIRCCLDVGHTGEHRANVDDVIAATRSPDTAKEGT